MGVIVVTVVSGCYILEKMVYFYDIFGTWLWNSSVMWFISSRRRFIWCFFFLFCTMLLVVYYHKCWNFSLNLGRFELELMLFLCVCATTVLVLARVVELIEVRLMMLFNSWWNWKLLAVWAEMNLTGCVYMLTTYRSLLTDCRSMNAEVVVVQEFIKLVG